MEYLKYFENKTSAEGYKTESYFVGYLGEENTVLYSVGGEVIKDGEMVMDEPDPTAGFVDLGLSVMWAECNLGASSPEETGLFYSWGEVEGHRLSADGVTFEDGHVFSSSTSSVAYADDISYTEYDAVTNYYKDTPSTYLLFRIPTAEQIDELLLNTTLLEEVINGVVGTRLTSIINNKSIFIPQVRGYNGWENISTGDYMLWSASTKYKLSRWSTGRACVFGKPDNATNIVLLDNDGDYVTSKWSGYQIRGVCSKLPTDNTVLLDKQITMILDDVCYFYPHVWLTTATKITFNTTEPIIMYISNTSDFEPTVGGTNILHTSFSESNGETQTIYLSEAQFTNINKQATGDFLYVRFSCPASTPVAIDEWDASECSNQSLMIYPNVSQRIAAKSRSVIYRLRYADFVGYDLTIKWEGASTLPTYISDICDYTPSTNNAALLLKPAPIVKARSTYLIQASVIEEWASRVDSEGYIYARFNPNLAGNVTFIPTVTE